MSAMPRSRNASSVAPVRTIESSTTVLPWSTFSRAAASTRAAGLLVLLQSSMPAFTPFLPIVSINSWPNFFTLRRRRKVSVYARSMDSAMPITAQMSRNHIMSPPSLNS